MSLTSSSVRRLSGFGRSQAGDAYVVEPHTAEDLAELFAWAAKVGRKVSLRGSGRSYGDAAFRTEEIVADLRGMNGLEFDPESGLARAGAGVTIQDLWQAGLPQGWWPPVVSGTQFPTLGGALAMNIHGKNAVVAGTLGEHVTMLEAVTPSGEMLRLTPEDPDFHAVISSAGLLAAITRVELGMKRVPSGDLEVMPVSCRDWDAQFDVFDEFSGWEYRVSWIDAFASGAKAGRGLFHAARTTEGGTETFSLDHQSLPDKIAGVVPKSQVWRILRLLTHDPGMRLLNGLKQGSGARIGDRRPYRQSLVAYSFLLDYVPGWERAYGAGGFIQYQSFVPATAAPKVFADQLQLLRDSGHPAYLAVLKRHRPDRFLMSHGVDGFSLALDLPARRWESLRQVCWRLNDAVLEAGGKFYLAKDSTLRPTDLEPWVGVEALARLRTLKQRMDPNAVLESDQAVRLKLFSNNAP